MSAISCKEERKQFCSFIQELAIVLIKADKSSHVLETEIPVGFEESVPSLISKSYNELSAASKAKHTTAYEKLNSKEYKSLYSLYHDIRLSSYIRINSREIGTEEYISIDTFYKFATEFILRESYRLHLDFNPEDNHKLSEDVSDFEEILSQDFIKVSTNYTLANAESYFIITQNNVPLFSSMNERSALDDRNIPLPEAFSSTKVIPQATSIPSTNFSFISAPSARVPQPTIPTEILGRFLHPNWYSLPTVKWLQTSDLQSFAPVIDEQNVVVRNEEKSRLWLEHIGYHKLFAFDNEAAETQKDGDRHENEEQSETNSDSDDGNQQDEDAEMTEDTKVENSMGVVKDIDHTVRSISLDNLYEWHPSNVIDDDEIEAFAKGEEANIVNQLIGKLVELRKNRDIKSSGGSIEPSDEERILYFKITRMLREILLSSNMVPDLKPSPAIPILQTNYSGTLPVPTSAANKKKTYKSKR